METKSLKELNAQFNKLFNKTAKKHQDARNYLVCLIYDEYAPRLWNAAVAIAKRDKLTLKQMKQVQISKDIYAPCVNLSQTERERLHILAQKM